MSEITRAQERATELIEVVYSIEGYAMKLTRDKEAAKDLLQQTVLKTLIANPSHEGRDLERWVSRVLYNTFVNEYRRKRRQQMISIADQTHLEHLLPKSAAADQQIIVEQMYQEILQLDISQQEVILLRIAGFSYKEIAEETGVAIGTIKSRIHFARKVLIEIMDVN